MSERTATMGDHGEIAANPIAWDEALIANGGHLLQSWRWGAFKDQFGWEAERVGVRGRSGIAMAQILFRSKAGVSIGYIPRGPVLPREDHGAAQELWRQIDRIARDRRALTIILEPDVPLPAGIASEQRLQKAPAPIQPSRSVKVELVDDENLLKRMHQKTRYNVRLAQRRGVTSRLASHSEDSVAQFYSLLQDTSNRNDFGIHGIDYYREFMRQFSSDATIIFAEIEGRAVAGVIAAALGEEAIYMYGGSSTKDRAHGAGFLIQFEAMRWARDRGCLRYDLWGIPHHDPDSTVKENGDSIAGTTGNDWRGLYEFKTRFGGEIVAYPEPLEKQYRPLLTAMARRLYRGNVDST